MDLDYQGDVSDEGNLCVTLDLEGRPLGAPEWTSAGR